MGWMFCGCSSLKSLDISHFNIDKVEDISWMFSGCSSLTNLSLFKFEKNKSIDMKYMFSKCNNKLKQKIKKSYKEIEEIAFDDD